MSEAVDFKYDEYQTIDMQRRRKIRTLLVPARFDHCKSHSSGMRDGVASESDSSGIRRLPVRSPYNAFCASCPSFWNVGVLDLA